MRDYGSRLANVLASFKNDCGTTNPARLAIAITILLIPLIFSAVLFIATNDPYGGTRQVPAIVVNLDKGAVDGDYAYNYGQQLCDTLIDNNSSDVSGEVTGFRWRFTSDTAAAAEGLSEGKYYMELIIPSNFSQSIVDADTEDGERAQILAYFNPSLNYSIKQIGEGVLTDIISSLNVDLELEEWNNILLTIRESTKDLLTLSKAGLDLTDGLTTARSGADELATGLELLAGGNGDLSGGLQEALAGAGVLKNGSAQLVGGIVQLASGIKLMRDSIVEEASSTAEQELTDALTTVADELINVASALNTEDIDEDFLDASLDAVLAAAHKAADANGTVGNVLLIYIVGGTLSYTVDGEVFESEETGLIPAIAAYVDAQQAMQDFEDNDMTNMFGILLRVYQRLNEVEEIQEPVQQDMTTYLNAVDAYTDAYTTYTAAAAAYEAAAELYNNGEITEEALANYYAAMLEADAKLASTQAALSTARTAFTSDLYRTDEEGNAEGILVRMSDLSDEILVILEEYGTVEDYAAFFEKLISLSTAEATAGAEASNAAGKVEGYLVGVAVMGTYASESSMQLVDALDLIYDGVAGPGEETLLGGASALTEGLGEFEEGIRLMANGGSTISVNMTSAAAGARELAAGLRTAEEMSASLFESLNAELEADEDLNGSEIDAKIAEVLSQPVYLNGEKGKGESLSVVTSFGTSMLPVYLILGLWIACLLALYLIDGFKQQCIMRAPDSIRDVIASYIPLSLFAIAAMLIAMLVGQFALGANVNFPVAFYLYGILVAIVMAVFTQMLCSFFKKVGLILAVILLMVQLSLCSGVFLVEAGLAAAAPIAALLPATTAVSGLRVAMCGIATSFMGSDVFMLFVALLLLLLLSVLIFLSIQKNPLAYISSKTKNVSPVAGYTPQSGAKPEAAAPRPVMTRKLK